MHQSRTGRFKRLATKWVAPVYSERGARPAEKRLARILLLLAHFDAHGSIETVVPKISHETLAEMVGTTRSGVCFFMKGFKESGFIFYENKSKLLRVHKSLLAFCVA